MSGCVDAQLKFHPARRLARGRKSASRGAELGRKQLEAPKRVEKLLFGYGIGTPYEEK